MNRLNGTSPLGRYQINTDNTITPGTLVALNSSGYAVPAADTANLKVVGIAKNVENNEVEVFDGIVSMMNAGEDAALTRADRGEAVYVVDAETVGKSSTNHIPAGILVDIYGGDAYFICDPLAITVAGLAKKTV